MAVKRPTLTKIIGPARTMDEKAAVLLSLINYDLIRNDPKYCKNTLGTVKYLYEKSRLSIPTEIKEYIDKVEKVLEDQ